MSSIVYMYNQYLAKEWKQSKMTLIFHEVVFKGYKILLLTCFLTIIVAKANAQEGPFLRFSLGPGFLTEYSSINASGFTYAAKNHAIGWGFNDKYAVYYSEFGASTKIDIGEEYQFLNLDAYGLGLSCNLENNISFHASGAYGTVHFSDSWKKQGDFMEDGYAIALGANKKWGLTKRIDLGVGPLISYFKTENYTFTNFSINFWLDIFLLKQQ